MGESTTGNSFAPTLKQSPTLNKPEAKVNLKALCVSQRKNKLYYPKTIPKERGPLANNISMCLCILLFVVHFFTSELSFQTILFLYTSAVLISIFVQILHRLIMTIEEYSHLESRYENSIAVMVKHSFYFLPRVLLATFLCFIYWTYYVCTHNTWAVDVSLWRLALFLTPTARFIEINLHLDSCPLNDSLWIAENNGLDYGSGMAYSFFHGYLKLVLKKTGTEDKNLKELMQDYEDKNKVVFSVHKLFILIPKSLTCFVSLKNEYSPSIDESSSLPEKKITVAGVQNRVYKNAVYKIIGNNKKTYVSAEYATPLKTFKDVFEKTGAHSEFYEKHKKDIILQFFLTLKNVLEKNDLSEFCELIYFEDSYADHDGLIRYHDVGKIILTRLKELKKHREKHD